jgi:hypothetical protein
MKRRFYPFNLFQAFLLMLLAGMPITVAGQTYLPSEIYQDVVLTHELSPYLIQNDLLIHQGATLHLEPGVTITFASHATMTVYGSLVAQGNKGDSVYFVAREENSPWQQINTYNAAITLQYSKISGSIRFVNAAGGNLIRILHCVIQSSATGSGEDCIAVHDAKRVEIDSNRLVGMGGIIAEGNKNDAIDLDHVDSSFVRMNIIAHFSDDGTDIGTEGLYTLISGNIISYCNYGISVGESSTVYTDHNIISHCDGGIQVHNHAILFSNYNTLYSNQWGIECFHSEEGNVQTGGTAMMQNTIFSATIDSEILTQSSSDLTITYSISDREILPGDHNLSGDPKLCDPENNNFSLQGDSPCINTGSPDGLGNGTSMGAVPYNGDPTGILNTPVRTWDFRVYPNPAVDLIHLETTGEESRKDIALFNEQGILLYHNTMLKGSTILDLGSFATGIYFLRLSAPPSSVFVRVIKY